MQKTRTWILIADAGSARVLETEGLGQPLHPVPAMSLSQDLPPSHELGTDRPPRGHESVGPARHAMEPKSDPHRKLKQSFAKTIADELIAAANAKSFDRLIIIAPPVLLGDLRKELPRNVKDRTAAEIAKDLVAVADQDIRKHLLDVVAF